MATQRYISTSFWDDEWITTLDPSEKLMYLYLMTNTLTNISGVYKITTRRINFDTGFNNDTIGHILTKFEKAKKAYRIGEYIALPSWPKHQSCETRTKIKDGIIACLKELPEEILKELVKIGYKFDLRPVFDTLSIPYPYDTNYSDIDSDSDIDIESKVEEKPVKQKRPKKGFVPPTQEEVIEYVIEKQMVINPYRFFDWYSKSDWKDNQDKQIKNWKNKAINWDSREREKSPDAVPYSLPSFQKSTAPDPEIICCGQRYSFNLGFCPQCGKKYNREGKEI